MTIISIILIKFTYLLTYSVQQSPSWEANRYSASQEIPRTLGTKKFITEFTSAHRLSLFWASSIQSIPPYPTSWSSTLILSSQLSLGLASGPVLIKHSSYYTCSVKTLFLLQDWILVSLVISSFVISSLHTYQGWGARWRSGQGTTLQTGRSRIRFPMVSLEFFSDIILPVAPWT
jgi:hypothetical protein